MESFVGRKAGRRSWRGGRIVCIKYAVSSRLSLPLNWIQTKISSVAYQMVEKSVPKWKLIMVLRNTSPSAAIGTQLTLHILRNLTWMEYEQRRRRREKKMITKKELISAPNRAMRLCLPPSPSSHSVHAFSGEFALADSVAGASGGTGAHMTVDAFGSPWTFFSYQTRTRSHQQIFLFHTRSNTSKRTQAQEEKIDTGKKKTGALTLHNRGARVVLGVNPDCIVVIFTQHIIVPVLAF